jgi:branched-subunit amino acid aminotransferase/4-amino-4-deoxychorismate lyase
LHDGCLRQTLFDDPDMRLTERVLFPADLAAADEVLLGNSVRGLLRAELLVAGERTAVSA